jgi:hypothetical protein
MNIIPLLSVLAAVISISCMPKTSFTRVTQGMTCENILTEFGQPIRIENKYNGNKDWYYRFSEDSRTTESNAVTSENATESTMEWSLEWSESELPIHISADGHVFGDIPHGRIIVNLAESGRGDGIAPVTPPTPPDMRVRIRRFLSDGGDRP